MLEKFLKMFYTKKTITKWYKVVNGDPGFTSEASELAFNIFRIK